MPAWAGDGELGEAQLGYGRGALAAGGDEPVAAAGGGHGAGSGLGVVGVEVAPGEEALEAPDLDASTQLDP